MTGRLLIPVTATCGAGATGRPHCSLRRRFRGVVCIGKGCLRWRIFPGRPVEQAWLETSLGLSEQHDV